MESVDISMESPPRRMNETQDEELAVRASHGYKHSSLEALKEDENEDSNPPGLKSRQSSMKNMSINND